MTKNVDKKTREESYVPFNVEIPTSLKRELALEKVNSGMTLRDIATAALSDYLRKRKEGK